VRSYASEVIPESTRVNTPRSDDALRYLDTFAKIDGRWYFAERKLLLDWNETRPSSPET
jgi:hypothetical protein